ncbi:hypothetical protein QC763_0097100 [Podospora pseudopauciseta]|uniref:Uncharacterized protein n=1 Tax=Podospora pseudopauciseta TaxID=2093780 RepID=A0ABR0H5J3_9PEZI|nr:hypothetical protein QC763_0097100 [Podospora pseudopauciseta]
MFDNSPIGKRKDNGSPEAIYERYAQRYTKRLNRRARWSLTYYCEVHGFALRRTNLLYYPRTIEHWKYSPPEKKTEKKKKDPESNPSPTSTTSYPLPKISTLLGRMMTEKTTPT